MLTLDLFVHLDAVDRNAWQGAPDERPLTDVGREQAGAMARTLSASPVDALYSSVALRCRASMEPLAARTGLPVTVLPTFQDTADKALAVVEEIRAHYPDGRVVICSYGDVIPAVLAVLAQRWHVEPPPRDNRKGVVFRVEYGTGIELREPGAA